MKSLIFIFAFLFGASAFSAELTYYLLSCHGRLISPFRYNLAKENVIIGDEDGLYLPAQKAAKLSYDIGLAIESIDMVRGLESVVYLDDLELTPSKLGLPDTMDGCKVVPLMTWAPVAGWQGATPVGDRQVYFRTPTADYSIFTLLYERFHESFLRDIYSGRFATMKTRQKAKYVADLPDLPGELNSLSYHSFSYFPPGLDQVAVELEKCTWWTDDIPKDCIAASRPLFCNRYEWGEGPCNSFYGDKTFLEWKDPISFWQNGFLKTLKFWHNYPGNTVAKIKLPKDLKNPKDLVVCGVGTISYSEDGILQSCPR